MSCRARAAGDASGAAPLAWASVRECHRGRGAWSDLQGRRSRNVSVVTRRIVVLSVACVLGAALTTSAQAAGRRGHCGPALCFRVARGWFGSVGAGVVDARPAASVLFGNFWFPARAAGHEGYPSVPPGKVLVALGDLPVVPAYARWPRVQRLRLPRNAAAKRVLQWHVRFAGRAVFLTVRFGSAPTRQMQRLTNAKLMAVYCKHR
jgi:hypothetical protein